MRGNVENVRIARLNTRNRINSDMPLYMEPKIARVPRMDSYRLRTRTP